MSPTTLSFIAVICGLLGSTVLAFSVGRILRALRLAVSAQSLTLEQLAHNTPNVQIIAGLDQHIQRARTSDGWVLRSGLLLLVLSFVLELIARLMAPVESMPSTSPSFSFALFPDDQLRFNFVWTLISGVYAFICLLFGLFTLKYIDARWRKAIGYVIVGTWVLCPPIFFWIDWVYYATPDANENAYIMHTHDLARNIWIGLVLVMIAVYRIKWRDGP